MCAFLRSAGRREGAKGRWRGDEKRIELEALWLVVLGLGLYGPVVYVEGALIDNPYK